MGNALKPVEAVMRAATAGEWVAAPDGHVILAHLPLLKEDVIVAGNYDWDEGGILRAEDANAIVMAHNLMPHLLRLWKVCEQSAYWPAVDDALEALNEAAFKELADDPA